MSKKKSSSKSAASSSAPQISNSSSSSTSSSSSKTSDSSDKVRSSGVDEELKRQVEAAAKFFDGMINLVPARYYLSNGRVVPSLANGKRQHEENDSDSDLDANSSILNNRFMKNTKQQSKLAAKQLKEQSKRNKLDPEIAELTEITANVQQAKRDKSIAKSTAAAATAAAAAASDSTAIGLSGENQRANKTIGKHSLNGVNNRHVEQQNDSSESDDSDNESDLELDFDGLVDADDRDDDDDDDDDDDTEGDEIGKGHVDSEKKNETKGNGKDSSEKTISNHLTIKEGSLVKLNGKNVQNASKIVNAAAAASKKSTPQANQAQQQAPLQQQRLDHMAVSGANLGQNATLDELQMRLKQRIELMRRKRKAKAETHLTAVLARKKAREDKKIKSSAGGNSSAAAPAAGSHSQQIANIGKSRQGQVAAATASASGHSALAISTLGGGKGGKGGINDASNKGAFKSGMKHLPNGNVVNEDGSVVFSKFDFSSIEREKKQKSQASKALSAGLINPHGKDFKKLIETMEQKKAKIEELKEKEPEKAQQILEKESWQKALAKAEGVKIKDDIAKLRKSAKAKDRVKQKSSQEWKERKQSVNKSIAKKQEIRQKHLQERIDGKKNKGKGKKANPSSNSPGKKKHRPGFEGK